MLICIIGGAVKCKKKKAAGLAVCEQGVAFYPNIIQTVLKRSNTYADTGEILGFLLITFTGAVQAASALHLTFIFCLNLTQDRCISIIPFLFYPDNFLLRSSKLDTTKQLTWRPGMPQN